MSNIISDIAKGYAGAVTEYGVNRGVSDPRLEDLMRRLSWQPGWPWCMAFALAVWLQAYTDAATIARIKRLGIGTQNAWQAADRLGFETSSTPRIGDIAIFQRTTAPGQGHAGIVVWVSGSSFLDVEGNTDETGTSEGDGVYARERILSTSRNQPGSTLRLLGFIRPPAGMTGGASLLASIPPLGIVVLVSAFLGGIWSAREGVLTNQKEAA